MRERLWQQRIEGEALGSSVGYPTHRKLILGYSRQFVSPGSKHMRYLIVISALVLAGCAQNPASIQADVVSSEMYADFSCQTLDELKVTKQAELDELYKAQKTKRRVDGWSNVLLLPGAASVVKDSSEAIAREKGEMNALIREYDRRCIDRSNEPGRAS